jgi:hypothetical protein
MVCLVVLLGDGIGERQVGVGDAPAGGCLIAGGDQRQVVDAGYGPRWWSRLGTGLGMADVPSDPLRDAGAHAPAAEECPFGRLRQNWYKGQSQRLAGLGQGAPPAVYAAISNSCSSSRRARWSRRWSSSPNLLPHLATTPEVVSEFVERSAETVRGPDVSESPHGIVALLDAPVVVF